MGLEWGVYNHFRLSVSKLTSYKWCHLLNTHDRKWDLKMSEMYDEFVYSAIHKLNSLYRSCRSIVARHIGNRTLIMQKRHLGDEFEEGVHKNWHCERQQQGCYGRQKATVPQQSWSIRFMVLWHFWGFQQWTVPHCTSYCTDVQLTDEPCPKELIIKGMRYKI